MQSTKFKGPRRPFSKGAPSTHKTPSSGKPSFRSGPKPASRYGAKAPSRFGGRPGGPSRFGGKPSGGSRFGSRPKRGGGFRERIDVSKFVSKATHKEKEEVYVPTHTFNDFKIDEKLKAVVLNHGFLIPSPIQDKAIPEVLLGKDIIGLADTGTGKTAAFLIPTINHLIHFKNDTFLIMTPTRELAQQIQKECYLLTKGLGVFSTSCVGGAPIQAQVRELRKKQHFIIGTPGRLKDLVKRKALDLSKIKGVVLDEGDRMLDMGFIDDINFLLRGTPGDKQMLLFSATLSKGIENIVANFLKDPVKISVKKRDTSKNVDQDVIHVASKTEKIDKLVSLLQKPDFDKVLVFTETKREADHLTRDLALKNILAVAIHGDKRQRERERSLASFKEGKVQVLVATDVAARGLHIDNVSHVINYEIPSTYDTYVHRIGRTGRANKKGFALTFVGA